MHGFAKARKDRRGGTETKSYEGRKGAKNFLMKCRNGCPLCIQ